MHAGEGPTCEKGRVALRRPRGPRPMGEPEALRPESSGSTRATSRLQAASGRFAYNRVRPGAANSPPPA